MLRLLLPVFRTPDVTDTELEMISRILFSSIVCFALSMPYANAGELKTTTVCAVVAEPQRFLGQELKIRANWTVSYHGILLQDESCPKVGISIQFSEDAETHGSVSNFLDLAYKETDLETSERQGPDSFTGQLLNYPGEIPYLVLDLHSFLRP